jgi:hypothetical protein
MADIATLGLTIDTRQVKTASTDLDRLARQAKQTEDATRAFGSTGARALREFAAANDNIASSSANASRGVGSLGAALSGLARGLAVGGVLAFGAGLKSLYNDLIAVERAAKLASVSTGVVQSISGGAALSGVSGDKARTDLAALGAKANKEMREGEGELTKLFEANNMKLTDRDGQLKNINFLMDDAARLISNANTEFDKIEIAKLLGLSEEWVKALEGGPAAFDKARQEAEAAGSVIDKDLIKRAADFDAAWESGWAKFGMHAKSAIASAASGISSMISSAASFLSGLGGGQTETGMGTRQNQMLEQAYGRNPALMRALRSTNRQGEIGYANTQPVWDQSNVSGLPLPPLRPARTGGTTIPSRSRGGGGSSSSSASDPYSDLIEATQQRISALETEAAALGMTEEAARLYRFEQELLLQAEKKGIELTPEKTAALMEYAKNLSEAKAKVEEMNKATADAEKTANMIGGAFKSFFSDIRSGFESGKKGWEVFTNAGLKAVDRLLNKFIEAQMNDIFKSLFSATGGSGGGGGFLASIFSSFLPAPGAVFASGGHVSGPGTGTSDSIPAWLSNGEYVVNAAATRKNRALLESINSGNRYAQGGLVGGGGGVQASQQPVVQIMTTQRVAREENARDASGRQVRRLFMEDVKSEMGSGGFDGAMGGRFSTSPALVSRG